jgi:phosphatidylserine/phosphatidylglycerophosphate/cardiolipin synthase-like enzyme
MEIYNEAVSVYFSPGKDPEDHILGFIKACTKTLDIAIYSLTSPEICAAVFEADKRGVAVRFIFDFDNGYSKYSAWTKWIRLARGNIQVKFKSEPGLMHNKFAIGDGRAVITGSYNWTETAEKVNHENLVIIRLESVVRKFIIEFDNMWNTFGALA